MKRVNEIFEELKLNRQPSVELEEECFRIIHSELKTEEDYEIKEKAVLSLVENYSKHQNLEKLKNLIQTIEPIVLKIKKSKTARMLLAILDIIALVDNTLELQSNLCTFLVSWCQKENRNFLRQKIQIRQSSILYKRSNYREALEIINPLLNEARKIDDKHLLVQIELIESKVYFAIKNYAKAKSALTACRAASNSIYCSPLLQADIDTQSGIVNAQDKDFKTAYSYFFEAFEYCQQSGKEVLASKAFQYMILCKIMSNSDKEVRLLLSGKYSLKYTGKDIQLIRKMAKAYKDKSLRYFQSVLEENKELVEKDPIIYSHIQNLYDNLLEQNLMKIVIPYSRVEISYVAQLVNLSPEKVQSKLSEMILDKKFDGTLDQGNECLIIFEEPHQGDLYSSALDTLDNMNVVVDKLFEKTQQLKKIK